MKKYILLSAIAVAAVFSSCQKVIDIDLNSKDPKIVIEANISDEPGPYFVYISQSVNFSEENSFPNVSGAAVTLADDLGNTETLTEVNPGMYQTSAMQGTPGHTYTLTVTANGNTYTASSTIPPHINLDTLVVESGSSFGGTAYYVIPKWQDPAGTGNYYRCIEYVNQERIAGSFLFDDAFSDGLVNGQPLLDFTTELVPGDNVLVEFQCVDKATYQYFYSMSQTANNQTAAPANPVTNWSNGALGYFSAHTVSRKTAIVQ